MINKLNQLKTWQALLIIAVVGMAVFASGLNNPFVGDDVQQIVDNIPVHSISNIKLFFEGGTFYNGQGIAPLSGVYFRPLMMTVFALLYTLFGATPLAFHVVQAVLCIGSACFLYLFFRYSFKPLLSLFLALVFLVHPMNSGVVFAVPTMQDDLFMFFGILGLWLLVRSKSIKGLTPVVLCLFLSILSKESGLLFVVMSGLYLVVWNRKRLLPFVGIMTPAVIAWVVLRINAVGFLANPNNAPIDRLDLIGRIMTMPSIFLFYISKFVFPWKLASGYYWVHPTFSVRYFVIPLIIDLVVLAIFVGIGYAVHKHANKAMSYTYVFFGLWTVLGLTLISQITPLDMTVWENWFYFSMIGVLGMIGVALTTLLPAVLPAKFDRRILVGLACILILVFGIRTAVRGTYWSSAYNLAQHDIVASPGNYVAYNNLAQYHYYRGEYEVAKSYTTKSIAIFPTAINKLNLGGEQASLGDLAGAYKTLNEGLKYQEFQLLYDNLAILTAHYGDPAKNHDFLVNSLSKFPTDSTLWEYLAISYYNSGDNSSAKYAIDKAASYGKVPQYIYDGIRNGKSFMLGDTPVPRSSAHNQSTQ